MTYGAQYLFKVIPECWRVRNKTDDETAMRLGFKKKLEKVLLLLLIAVCFCVLLWGISRLVKPRTTGLLQQPRLVMWWTTMPQNYNSVRMCGNQLCAFTAKRQRLSEAGAVLFYGSDLQVDDLPLPRQQNQMWALLHEESPRNVPFMPHKVWLRHFNFTSTFSRHSDLPLTTHYLPDARDLTSPTYVVPVGEKSLYAYAGLVLFMQSDCDTMSGREDYLRELMRYVRVDSYGACLNNHELPDSLKKQQHNYLNNLYSPEVYRLMARYKFVMAYENGVCDDYITEKFWRPLIVGSIPVYFGSPTIKDWAPNEKSYIDISQYSSPKELADHLNKLDLNDSEYNTYLEHKYNMLEPIRNKRLLRELVMRDSSISKENLFETFECAVCTKINGPSTAIQMASESHYRCPHEPVYPQMTGKVSNADTWHSVMAVGRCQAYILDRLLQRNEKFSKNEFDKLLSAEINANKCD